MTTVGLGLQSLVGKIRQVEIANCVNFSAFRYGRGECNPYEDFALSLLRGEPIDDVRAEFENFLRRYRPRDLGEALGVRLTKSYPLWYLPWRSHKNVQRMLGWQKAADSITDVMTYFSTEGIPASGVAKEVGWHQRACASIGKLGYVPDKFGYITVRELRGPSSVFLVVDGNHRISALSVRGNTSIPVRQLWGSTIRRTHAKDWPLVRDGVVSLPDALEIFDAYFNETKVNVESTGSIDIVNC